MHHGILNTERAPLPYGRVRITKIESGTGTNLQATALFYRVIFITAQAVGNAAVFCSRVAQAETLTIGKRLHENVIPLCISTFTKSSNALGGITTEAIQAQERPLRGGARICTSQ